MIVRRETLAVVHLDLFFHDEFLYPATGFIYKYGQTTALVTNWHVFSGVNPITGVHRHEHKFYPTRVEFNLNLFYGRTGQLKVEGVGLDLVDEGGALWFQHKDEQHYDIAAIILDDRLGLAKEMHALIQCLYSTMFYIKTDSEEYAEHAWPRVASEVFILGFPKGLSKQGVFPIWKRGSIASEPLIAIDGKPIIMIDAVTRDGMSGAPVLYFGNELTNVRGHEREGVTGEPWLVGVYAGREGVTKAEEGMTLGRVWRRDILDDMFYSNRPGSRLTPWLEAGGPDDDTAERR